MAFDGYLIKVGSYILPNKYIQEKTYSAKVNTIDEDSYNDNNGILHRNVIQKIPIVKANTVSLSQAEVDAIMSSFRSNYSVANERKASVSVWIPELGKYVTQDMYLSDIDFVIDVIKDGVPMYEPFELRFNGYGED